MLMILYKMELASYCIWKKGFKMRIFLFLLLAINLMANSFDSLLLKTQAIIFPKIILLDKDVENKLFNNKIVFSIVYTKNELSKAEQLKSMIDKEYMDRLDKYDFEVQLLNEKQFFEDNKSTSYYLFNSSISTKYKKNHIYFGYDYKNFNDNILISLFVQDKTYIYLNKIALSKCNIRFLPVFYKIARFK